MRRNSVLTVLFVAVLLLSLLVSGQPAAAIEKDIKQGVLRASVKLMTPFDANEDAGSLCSGTMLNQEGYILTNFHCIGYVTSGRPEKDLEDMGLKPGDLYNKRGMSIVALTDNPRQLPAPTYVAQVRASDSDLDLAVLKIVGFMNSKQALPKTLPVVAMPLADSDAVETLDNVIVLGYPGIGGDTVTATEGKISGFIDEDSDGVTDWFKTDVLVNQGNSGGSAINDKGELVGVPTARLSDRSGNIIYLIRPSNHAVPLIQKAMQAGNSAADSGKSTPPDTSTSNVPAGKNIGAFTFGTGFGDKGVTGAATTFKSGALEVHAAVPYQNMRDGTLWGFVWQLDGNAVSGQEDLKWNFGKSGILDLYLKSKQGLSDGTYNLQVLIKGTVVQEGQFVVGSGKGKNTPQKPKNTKPAGVTLTGKIIDRSTRKPIQGALIVVLQPGKTIDDFDADESENKTGTVLAIGAANANGQYTTDVPLPRGATYSVIVGAKNYQRIAEDDALEIDADTPDVLEVDPIALERR